MGRKTVKTTASGLNQFIGKQGLAPLDTEEVTELGQYFPSSGGGGEGFEPTEAQLEAMNSGITAAKVAAYDTLPDEDDVKDIISDHFVAGTNVTITDNVDGTQTIASTASGGTSDYSDLSNKPSINNVTLSGNKTTADLGISEVPTITSSDDGKYLKAYYDNSDVNYEWAELPGVNEVPNPMLSDTGKVLTATGTGTYAWTASSAPTPPTAYTETLTGRSWNSGSSSFKSVVSDGGFVVVDNICTFNIYVTFTYTGATSVTIPSDKKIIYGFPAPCSTGPVPKFIGFDEQSTPITFRGRIDTSGDLLVEYTSTSLRAAGFYLTGSYLVDPTWSPT